MPESGTAQPHTLHHQWHLGGWTVDKKISVGNVLTIVLLLYMVLYNWWDLGWRVKALEERVGAQEAATKSQTLLLQRIDANLEHMKRVDEDFPAHRHMEGWVVYPRGQNPEPIEDQPQKKGKKPTG